MKVIYLFTPIHVGFLEVICYYLIYSVMFLISESKDTTKYVIIFISSFIVIVFGTLLFCEILTINVCGLNYNTKKGIMERAIKEEIEPNSSTQTSYLEETEEQAQ